MYLKKIALFGFKSFADKTTISFEKGVTGIVGPNGCGKSNISDAIRWVLGEKSAKLLRGGKMEDLIFAGTEYRKPLGFAEVSLTISNEDKIFPVAYEEVVITRRLYRNGESEYLLNKTPCRLKDIQDLIMDTGIGSNAYSMVEQGEIDYLVNAKADERRFLIEEAAGISKYKNKKEEALRKLERTEANLLRVNDIVSELEKNIKYAERQAKRAESFKQKFEDLKKLELFKARHDLLAINETRQRTCSEKELRSVREQELGNILAEFDAHLSEGEAALRELENEVSSLEEQKYSLKNQLSSISNTITFNKEKIAELQMRNEQLKIAVEHSSEKSVSLQAELDTRQRELETFYQDLEKEQAALDSKKTELHAVVSSIAKKNEYIERIRTDMMNLNGEAMQKRNEFHKVVSNRSGIKNKIERIEQTMQRLELEEKEILNKIQVSAEEIDLFLSAHTSAKEKLDGLISLKKTEEQNLKDLRETLFNKKNLLYEIDSKLKTLEDLEGTLSLYKEGSKKILGESKQDGNKYHNAIKTVLETLEVHSGFERAIQTALSECLYSLLVETYSDAMELIGDVSVSNKGSIDIFINGKSENVYTDATPYGEGVVGSADLFVTIKDNDTSGIKEVLKKILIVDSFSSLDSSMVDTLLAHYHLVSQDGTVITRDRVVKWRSESELLTGVLVRDERKGQLKIESEKVQDEIAGIEEKNCSIEQNINAINAEIEQRSEEVLEKKVALESNEKITTSIRENLNKIKEHTSVLRLDKAEANEELQGLIVREEELEHEISQMNTHSEAIARELEEKNNELKNIENTKEALQIELATLEGRFNTTKENEAYLKTSLDVLSFSFNNEQDVQKINNGEIEQNSEKTEQLIHENAQLEEKVTLLSDQLTALEKTFNEVQEKRHEQSAILNEKRNKSVGERKEYQDLKDLLHEMQLKEMDLNYQETSLCERILQTYKINIHEYDFAGVDQCAVNVDTLDDDIAGLKKRVESLGTVNLLAIEEYNEVKDRYTFLTEQRADLENAQGSLLEAIRKINRTTKQLFIDVFSQVQKNFLEYYTILFSGGTAQLILVDEENPLESGIDILVRPPGKKLQHIGLLSGGEKALTAVALLFALFKVKPSPFCVLDEVDAPLDEANIDRFLEVVRQFSDSTQFIIVTHSRKTIAIADTLFGITMQEAGVSKMVSVKVSDIEFADTAGGKEKMNLNDNTINILKEVE